MVLGPILFHGNIAMLRFVVFMLGVLALLPPRAVAQSAPGPHYAFCYVMGATDSPPVPIWASQVFEYDAPAHDMDLLNQLAGAFLRHVAGLGGSGAKQCVALTTRAEAENFRQEQRAIWDRRDFFIKIGNWQDVVWTPPPRASIAVSSAPVSRYFRCHATLTDVPDGSALAWTVASDVFERPVPGDRALSAAMDQARVYQQAFAPVAQAHGIPADQARCISYDTLAEARTADKDFRDIAGGYNLKLTIVSWSPSATAAPPAGSPPAVAAGGAPAPDRIGLLLSPVTAELKQALGLGTMQGAWVVEVADGGAAQTAGFKAMDIVLEIAGQAVATAGDVSAIVTRLRPGFEALVRVWRERGMQELTLVVPPLGAPGATQAAVSQGAAASTASPPASAVAPTAPVAARTVAAEPPAMYCVGAVTRSDPQIMLRTPIGKLPTADASHATLGAALDRVFAAAKQTYPGSWRDDATKCYDNTAVFRGETFCIANSHSHFRGAQSVALWCNASRDTLVARAQDLDKRDGGAAQVLAWPER